MVSKSLAHLQTLTEKLNQKDKEVKISESRLKLALKAANVGMWHWCHNKDELIWDRRMFEIFRPDLLNEVNPDTWRGTYNDFSECIHKDDLDKANEIVYHCLNNGDYYNATHRIVHKNGDIKYVKMLGQALDKGLECGSNMCMTGVCIDVTNEVTNA